MVKSKIETVVVAYRFGAGVEIVCGSAKSVVLGKIGVSARKLGLAAKRGAVAEGGGIVVSGKGGVLWTVCEVAFLRVRRENGGKVSKFGFKQN